MHIAGILLAAGKGERYGGDKLLATLPSGPLRGQALGRVSAFRLCDVVPDTVAVVRAGDTRLAAALAQVPVRVVECAGAADGMGASLACGIAATRDAGGWIVALADMPWIAATTLHAVVAALHAGASIVAPSYRSQRGHPVGFAAHHGAALAALNGDTGARAILARHAADITLVEVDDPAILRDVDTPTDLSTNV